MYYEQPGTALEYSPEIPQTVSGWVGGTVAKRWGTQPVLELKFLLVEEDHRDDGSAK